MKHAFLTCCAALCGTFAASALDASSALTWIDKSADRPGAVNFTTVNNSAVPEAKAHTAPARGWQCVNFPLHVEGRVKEDAKDPDKIPHFIPELRVKMTVVVETMDERGQVRTRSSMDGVPRFVMLQKEMTLVDIPLVKISRYRYAADAVVNVGMYISPADAYKLSMKDGNLDGRVAAIAVACQFKRAGGMDFALCSPRDEKTKHDKTKEDVYTTYVFSKDAELKNMLKARWWTKAAGDTLGVMPRAISETPFALNYISLGHPASRPLVGPAESGAASAPASAAAETTPAESGVTPSETTETTPSDDTTGGDSTPTGGDSSADSESSEDDSRDRKRSRRSRRSRR